jgi:rhamnose utilization protein RhaD (predicted bifunctional aldolase and dehydrogenase)/NAD(P)-dependent dehydrogenase (short-subunit alcohol dehydrogenase family)
MKSLWSEADARAAVERYSAQGVSEDLALRTYSARLLGADRTLVLHGGGNTSVKTTARDVFGEVTRVLCVKGSGWDLATIEPAGHPAVRLEPLLRLRELPQLSDEAMVNVQRQNLLDTLAPNPSVETLLHAFIPETFIDHTHALDILALANQPNAEALIAEVYGDRVACVPYVMPGFDLAKRAALAYEAQPGLEGLVLLRHGVFSFGSSARESYERMIALVDTATSFLDRRVTRNTLRPGTAVQANPAAALPVLRGVVARAAGGRWPQRWVFDLRSGDDIRTLVDDPRLPVWAARGVATPDHVIRTKRHPLVLEKVGDNLEAWGVAAQGALEAYMAEYEDYFSRNASRSATAKITLDPLPRVAVIPELGLVGLGRNSADAAVAADIAHSWGSTLLKAESIGEFAPLDEADTFDMEYWSLEQAKLRKTTERRLEGRVVVISGGAGAIGAATAHAFTREGAEIALLDVDAGAVARTSQVVGRNSIDLACDVRDPEQVHAAFDAVCRRFGGVDVVISNAGTALTGMIANLSERALRESFELNFFAHQNVAREAVRVMQAQKIGGVILFNVSKQALNPGPNFGAYGTAKAALLALMRQYALEHGADGIRVNALNPDRIRSGLLTEAMILSRAAARGMDEGSYMAGNLLGEEVTAEDVAQAFVFTALMGRTTGAIIPVDGGNVAAMVR